MLRKSNCRLEVVTQKKWLLWVILASPKINLCWKSCYIWEKRILYLFEKGAYLGCLAIGYFLVQKIKRYSRNSHSMSIVVIHCHFLSFDFHHFQSLYYSLLIIVALLVTRCHNLNQSLSHTVPLVVSRCHSLSFVVIHCTTRCNSLSLYVSLTCPFINNS